jgi:nucleoside-diphosphate-sugar epimerase
LIDAEAHVPPKVLVTGASGFVGRALCVELARHGYRVRRAVRTLDTVPTPTGEVVPIGTLSGATDWSAAVAGVDAIVHLAARVHVMRETARDPLALFREVNVDATEALARAAAGRGVKRLVYVSSIKVNGEHTPDVPFRPDDVPQPQDPYGISKWHAEQTLWRIARETGLEVVVVRPPLVYGPGVKGNFLRLLRLARLGIPLPIGALKNRRSMVYVANLCDALTQCIPHPRAAGNTFLVSDGEDLSTCDLVARLAHAGGARARLWRVSPRILRIGASITGRSAEIDRLASSLIVDSSCLLDTLGWTPPFSVDEGLRETVQWYCRGASSAA